MKRYLLLIVAIIADYNLHVVTLVKLPQIDLIVLYFISKSDSSLSIMVLFLCGMIHDMLYVIPLGLTAIIYIAMNTYIFYSQDRIINRNSDITLFIKAIILLTSIEWLLMSLYYFAPLSMGESLLPAILTILTYTLISKVATRAY